MTPENILWRSFLGDAKNVEFDPNRYINWRFFWDYSGGNVYENMCHQLSFWYKVMDLKIPRAVTMTGGIYLWKDGREVPDTMSVTMEHEEELLYTWDSGFGNDQLKITEDVLGDNGTLSHTPQSIKYTPQKVNRKDGNEMTGTSRSDPKAHMQNFFDSIRAGKQPNCPFELGFRISVACRMAVESYRQQRTIQWDPAKEEIV
jgi:predicted dehydrogenase